MASLDASIIFMLLFTLLSFSSEAAPTYSSYACDNATTFTPNSTYQANIKTLLSSLSSSTNSSKNGFYNTTAGQDPNLVYGTFLCRGDVSANLCQDCVASASNDITQRCLTEKVGVIWYDECTVRYSDQNIFSIIREVPSVDIGSSGSIADEDRFNQLLSNVMTSLENRAAYGDQSGKRFAAGEANFTSSQTLYSLVQCTPDLTDALCFRCFQSAIATLPTCCDGKQGARVLLPSCNIRYEMFPFYHLNGTDSTVLVPSPSSPNSTKEKTKTSTKPIIAIAVPVVVSVVLFAAGFCLLTRNRKKYDAVEQENAAKEIATEECLQFDFSTIEAATNKFSDDNKLGEGGFGPVYKGKLPNGQEIAVKRLSVRSSQGAVEYKNEVALVAKLQHRNLVRLLGFCLEGAEKLLIYEFVPNKSLDYFLFDLERQGQLNWTKRFKIIGGIARGILYLHEDSRLKIIHRDLKTSNILLDENMNSKISDFGLARIFGVDQSEGSTSKIVGTYGYMPPEYAMHGLFSVKSDVYSFGVIILEIITGKKINNFQSTDGASDLLSYAWKHWNNGTPLELLDPSLRSSYSRNEVSRCIHIGLLCVQEDPTERPTMAAIVLMLNSYSITLQAPRPPATFLIPTSASKFPTDEEGSDQSPSKSIPFSVNEASISDIYPR